MAEERINVSDLVEAGYRHHLAGRLEEAQRCYLGALQRDPGHARALALAGALALQAGDARSAARLLQRAVEKKPNEASAWNNLGAARAHLGDRGGAMEAYRRAVSVDPRQFDARNNLGSLLLTGGEPAAAVPILREALAIRPSDSGCRRAFAAALRGAGDPWRAAKELESVSEEEGADPEFWRELAGCRAEIEDHPGAEVAWRRVLERKPEDSGALAGLASALRGQERFREAVDTLDRVLSTSPGEVDLWMRKGNVLLAAERFQEAAQTFKGALEIEPGHLSARLNLGIACLKQARLDEAERWFDGLEGEYPDDGRVRYYRALTALAAGDAERALARFEGSLDADPLNINSIWYRYHCLRELGRDEQARETIHPPDDVALIKPLEDLSGAERDEYLKSLNAFICEYPQQWWEPADKTTRGGHQTPSLPLHEPEVMRRFESMVRGAVEEYVRALPGSHVLRAHWPQGTRLSVWGTLLQRGGHQKPHIHPGGVVSGVFYTRLPTASGSGPQAGWIEFGGTPYATPTRYEPELHRVEPEPGLLVLFPSYVPHGTVPFESDELRVSIAFDVMPAP